MQTGLDSFQVTSELLVYAFVALGDYFVRVVNETAADTRHPCAHATTTLAPEYHALAIAGHFIS